MGENSKQRIYRRKPYTTRQRNADQIIESIREKIEKVEGIQKSVFDVDTGMKACQIRTNRGRCLRLLSLSYWYPLSVPLGLIWVKYLKEIIDRK